MNPGGEVPGPALLALDALATQIEVVLDAHPSGLSEFALLRHLMAGQAASNEGVLHAQPFSDPLSLFQTHFIVFHVLYRLRDRMLAERRGELEINCLRIARSPHRDPGNLAPSGNRLPILADPMRAYYLDLENLRRTTSDDVEALLQSFWTRYGARDRRAEALLVIGLVDPVDQAAVKRRYHQLALELHPDRGGDGEHLCRINSAMAILRLQ